MKPPVFVLLTGIIALSVGFALGTYALPIIVAHKTPKMKVMEPFDSQEDYIGHFKRELKDSDFFHWGEGIFKVTETQFMLKGAISPGPSYKLYFSPFWIETEKEFMLKKNELHKAADIVHFRDFVVDFDVSLNPKDYKFVIIWCEAFDEFITAGEYELASSD